MINKERIYLASPYTHKDITLRNIRYIAACHTTADLMRNGCIVFSPIVHSHTLAAQYSLPKDFDFWQDWCLSFIKHWATQFCILDIDGWETSKGLAAEKELAEKMQLPIFFYSKYMDLKL